MRLVVFQRITRAVYFLTISLRGSIGRYVYQHYLLLLFPKTTIRFIITNSVSTESKQNIPMARKKQAPNSEPRADRKERVQRRGRRVLKYSGIPPFTRRSGLFFRNVYNIYNISLAPLSRPTKRSARSASWFETQSSRTKSVCLAGNVSVGTGTTK